MLPSEFLQKGWCQHARRRDRHRDLTLGTETDTTPVEWCMVGSIQHSHLNETERVALINALNDMLDVSHIGAWQDGLPKTEASRAKVISIMVAAEVAAGIRKEEECNYLVSSSNKAGHKEPYQEIQKETTQEALLAIHQ